MISCKKATELISKSMEEPLSIKESLELSLHNFICEFCHKFHQQVRLLRESLKPSADRHIDYTDTPIPTGAKERLKQKLFSENGVDNGTEKRREED